MSHTQNPSKANQVGMAVSLIIGLVLVAVVFFNRFVSPEPVAQVAVAAPPIATTAPISAPASAPTSIVEPTTLPSPTARPTALPTRLPAVPVLEAVEAPLVAADPALPANDSAPANPEPELAATPAPAQIIVADTGGSTERDGAPTPTATTAEIDDGQSESLDNRIDGQPQDASADLDTPTPTATVVFDEVSPTATVAAEPSPTFEPIATEIPVAAPTAGQPPAPTATPTPEPVSDTGSTQTVAEGWFYVDSVEGLFLRSAPGGAVDSALDHRTAVYANGRVVRSDDRLWMELLLPANGWVALEYLVVDQPAAIPTPTVDANAQPPSAEDWQALRMCESGNRYDVVDPSGLYHGAYQFLPSTWDGLARRFAPNLEGVLPSTAAPAEQDFLAMQLFILEGARPWPECGRHLL